MWLPVMENLEQLRKEKIQGGQTVKNTGEQGRHLKELNHPTRGVGRRSKRVKIAAQLGPIKIKNTEII